jgi:ABC-2 type transport system permease protein
MFFREKQAVFWNFLFPLFLMIFFGLIFGKGNQFENISIQVGVVDNDQGSSAKNFVQIIEKIPVLKVQTGKMTELEQRLKKRKINYLLIIPKGFKRDEDSFKPIEVKYDPQQVNINRIGFTIFDQILLKMNEVASGRPPVYTLKKSAVDQTEADIRYIDWLVPGILAMSLLSSALFGVGVVIASEREKGQLKRFAVTPLPKSRYIATQILQRFFIAILQALLIIFVATLIFSVKMKGNWLLLFFVLCLGLLAFSALGYAIAARIKKAQTTAAVANIIFMPMMFLSGVYFPVEVMPSYLRPIAKILPLTYLNDVLRLIFQGQEVFSELLLPLLVLAGWLVVCFMVAVKLFIWE